MFQLTFRLIDVDGFTHQISQMGAHFLSKGPEVETYFPLEQYQLRLQQGANAELVLVQLKDHYIETLSVDIAQHPQLRELLRVALGERCSFPKQVVRYHFKKVLLEIHRYEKLGDFLYVIAEDLQIAKQVARILGVSDKDRVNETPADLVK